MAEVGLWWCGATPPSTETEDLDVKVCEEAITSARTHGNDCRKAVVAGNGQSPRPHKADPGSKQSRVIAMLQSPAGANIAAIMKATGWQQHSVRGFLAGVVRNRLKLKLGSKKVDGIRVYQIAGVESSKPRRRKSERQSS
jgi:hypothetical protein